MLQSAGATSRRNENHGTKNTKKSDDWSLITKNKIINE